MAILDTSAPLPNPNQIISIEPVTNPGTQGKTGATRPAAKAANRKLRSVLTLSDANQAFRDAFQNYSQKHQTLYKAIFGRRFLLPKYRQNQYHDQEILNAAFAEQIHCMTLCSFSFWTTFIMHRVQISS